MSIFPSHVPASLSKDAWWLAATTGPGDGDGGSTQFERTDWRMWGRGILGSTLPLIALGDWLFWDHGAGISLAMFGLALLAAMLILRWDAVTPRTRARASAVAVLGVLPSMVAIGFFPVMFLLLGTIGAALLLHERLSIHIGQALKAFAIFVFTGPFWIIRDAFSGRPDIARDIPARHILNGWALPAGLGLIFLSLFIQANPVFEDTFDLIFGFDWLERIDFARIFFWLGLLMLLWPFLNMRPGTFGHSVSTRAARSAPNWLAQDTIRNALFVFNLLFAAQTVLDVAYLWGGVALPDGMTYAEYAHRGAYPLLATALLAGIFMLCATMFEAPSAVNRKLLYLWIAQNAALVLSSVLRLDLYVSFYSLTYLRVAAFIWMGLVAVGLVLIAVRIAQDRTNGWVLTRIAGVGTGVLYLCSFVNFASLIGNYNVTHSLEVSGTGLALDRYYLCNLGPDAYPAADRFYAETNLILDGFHMPGGKPGWLMERFERQNQNWREWGFRDAALRRYLATAYPKGVEAGARYSDR